MKRLFRGVLLVWLFISISLVALADESGFRLRNDVCFGDAYNVVKEKETLDVDTRYGDKHNLYTVEGSVAGIDGTSIWYRFDESTGALFDVRWSLPHRTEAADSDLDYNKLYNALVSKYGAPIELEAGEHYFIRGSAISAAEYNANWYKKEFSDGAGRICAYAEWTVDAGAGQHVKIEIVQQYYGSKSYNTKYAIAVGYSSFTQEELDEGLRKQNEENAALMNDI